MALCILVSCACNELPDDLGAEEPRERESNVAAAYAVSRPDGWADDSHGKDATPDYARLFPDDVVQRIDVVLSPESYAQMMDDLRARCGDPSTGAPSAGAVACRGLTSNAPCKLLGLEGVCKSALPFIVPAQGLNCHTKDMDNPIDLVPGDPIPVAGTIRYDGKVWNQVAVRFKGNSSLSRAWSTGVHKLGLKFDFDKLEDAHPEIKDQRFFGFGEMTLAPGYRDPSFLRDKLASDLARDMGMVGARSAFYQVYVDVGAGPVYWGLYTMLEDPTDRLLDIRFGDGTGNIYKPDGPGADFASFNPAFLDKKSNDPNDFSDVKRLFDVLHAPHSDLGRWRAELERAFDVDTFLRNMAFNRVINEFDSYGSFPHNYYLYGDPSHGGRLVWIGWDHNMAWSAGRGSAVMIDDPFLAIRWPLMGLAADPVYRARYRDFLGSSIEGPYEKARFEVHARALHALIAKYVVGPEGERVPYSFLARPQDFESELDVILSTAEARRTAVRQALTVDLPRK